MQIVANESTQRGLLVQGLDSKVQEMFLDMWLNDLSTTSASSSEQIITNANSIFKYFRSPLRAVAVDWDDHHSCFIWLLEKDLSLLK
jgi:hypothetical protein